MHAASQPVPYTYVHMAYTSNEQNSIEQLLTHSAITIPPRCNCTSSITQIEFFALLLKLQLVFFHISNHNSARWSYALQLHFLFPFGIRSRTSKVLFTMAILPRWTCALQSFRCPGYLQSKSL